MSFADDMIDSLLGEAWNSPAPVRAPRDWHRHRNDAEPRCAADQWRTRDRDVVLYMSEMGDQHLGHCIRFASTKPQHKSRLAALLAERGRRS